MLALCPAFLTIRHAMQPALPMPKVAALPSHPSSHIPPMAMHRHRQPPCGSGAVGHALQALARGAHPKALVAHPQGHLHQGRHAGARAHAAPARPLSSACCQCLAVVSPGALLVPRPTLATGELRKVYVAWQHVPCCCATRRLRSGRCHARALSRSGCAKSVRVLCWRACWSVRAKFHMLLSGKCERFGVHLGCFGPKLPMVVRAGVCAHRPERTMAQASHQRLGALQPHPLPLAPWSPSAAPPAAGA